MDEQEIEVVLYFKDPHSTDGYGRLAVRGKLEHIEWNVDGNDPRYEKVGEGDVYQIVLATKDGVLDTVDLD